MGICGAIVQKKLKRIQWFVLQSLPCLACVLACWLWLFHVRVLSYIYRYVCVYIHTCVFLVRNVFPSVCVCPKSPSTSDEPGEESKEGCVQVCPVTLFLSVLCCSYTLSGLLCTKVWGTSTGQQMHFIQTMLHKQRFSDKFDLWKTYQVKRGFKKC